jgi:hypothetical protein
MSMLNKLREAIVHVKIDVTIQRLEKIRDLSSLYRSQSGKSSNFTVTVVACMAVKVGTLATLLRFMLNCVFTLTKFIQQPPL